MNDGGLKKTPAGLFGVRLPVYYIADIVRGCGSVAAVPREDGELPRWLVVRTEKHVGRSDGERERQGVTKLGVAAARHLDDSAAFVEGRVTRVEACAVNIIS